MDDLKVRLASMSPEQRQRGSVQGRDDLSDGRRFRPVVDDTSFPNRTFLWAIMN